MQKYLLGMYSWKNLHYYIFYLKLIIIDIQMIIIGLKYAHDI